MRWLLGALWCVASLAVQALEFRAVSAEAAVLYDAPSAQAQKLFILSRHYPVEIIVALDKWVKVRDASGALAWVESSKLAAKRTVLITSAVAEIRAQPDAAAALVFKAERDVALELVEIAGGGWIKVKHRDGQSGFVPLKEVWGI
jgi:SH3-like domain-containing protein